MERGICPDMITCIDYCPLYTMCSNTTSNLANEAKRILKTILTITIAICNIKEIKDLLESNLYIIPKEAINPIVNSLRKMKRRLGEK